MQKAGRRLEAVTHTRGTSTHVPTSVLARGTGCHESNNPEFPAPTAPSGPARGLVGEAPAFAMLVGLRRLPRLSCRAVPSGMFAFIDMMFSPAVPHDVLLGQQKGCRVGLVWKGLVAMNWVVADGCLTSVVNSWRASHGRSGLLAVRSARCADIIEVGARNVWLRTCSTWSANPVLQRQMTPPQASMTAKLGHPSPSKRHLSDHRQLPWRHQKVVRQTPRLGNSSRARELSENSSASVCVPPGSYALLPLGQVP